MRTIAVATAAVTVKKIHTLSAAHMVVGSTGSMLDHGAVMYASCSVSSTATDDATIVVTTAASIQRYARRPAGPGEAGVMRRCRRLPLSADTAVRNPRRP